jgi:hypothetical protein
MNYQALCINKEDNVAVTLKALKAGERVLVKIDNELQDIIVVNDVPIYHKFAIKNVKPGEKIYKYGQVMGIAAKELQTGEHVHIHNIESLRGVVECT